MWILKFYLEKAGKMQEVLILIETFGVASFKFFAVSLPPFPFPNSNGHLKLEQSRHHEKVSIK